MQIQNLEAYTGVKSLWIEGNGISRIQNIAHMKNIRCLYLQEN